MSLWADKGQKGPVLTGRRIGIPIRPRRRQSCRRFGNSIRNRERRGQGLGREQAGSMGTLSCGVEWGQDEKADGVRHRHQEG